MNFRKLSGMAFATVLTIALPIGIATAQTNDSGGKQDVKAAGHESKNAAVDAGHGIKQGTKKGYHKTKHGVKHLGHKIEGKKDTPANNPPA